MAKAADAPDPAGCADYAANKSGGDAACDAAIAKESDPTAKSVMLFRRAYMEDAAGDFAKYPKALADLDAAIKLWPENFLALHERAYLHNEYGHWREAEKDLDVQIRLKPGLADGYVERALARFKLGALDGMTEDADAAVMLAPAKPGNYILRARAALWHGRFDAARADLDKAQALAGPAGDGGTAQQAEKLRAQMAAWTKRSANPDAQAACREADEKGDYSAEGLIGDCTRAFLDARTPKDRADMLTDRAMAWLMGPGDEDQSTADSAMAAAIDPSDTNLSNLGFAYMRVRHSSAAIEQFDRSIALKPDFYNYAGRASAKSNVGDYDGAIADAKASLAIRNNDLALIVEGDAVYAQTKSYDKAKPFWIAAWRAGGRDDGIKERLKEAGVPVPPPDGAPVANTP